jgi:hypothetical protein
MISHVPWSLPTTIPGVLRSIRVQVHRWKGQRPHSHEQQIPARVIQAARRLHEILQDKGGGDKRKEAAQFCRQWTVLVSALRLATRIGVGPLRVQEPHHCKAAAGLWALAEWAILVGESQGHYAFGKAIKQWANEATAEAVGAPLRAQSVGFAPRLTRFICGTLRQQWTIDAAWAFANVGRSIPPAAAVSQGEKGRINLIAIELQSWQTRLTTAFEERSEDLLTELTNFVRNKVQRATSGWKDRADWLGPVKLNRSACLERSRAKGGTYDYYLSQAEEATESEALVMPVVNRLPYPCQEARTKRDPQGGVETLEFRAPTGTVEFYSRAILSEEGTQPRTVVPQVPKSAPRWVRAERTRAAVLSRAESEFESMYGHGALPPAKPIVLEERGQKWRIASRSPACLVVLGQRINSMLLRILKRTGPHVHTLSGGTSIPKPVKHGAARWAASPNFEFSSTDLSAASDWIPHEVALAAFEGVSQAMGDRLTPLYYKVARACLGPQSIPSFEENFRASTGVSWKDALKSGADPKWAETPGRRSGQRGPTSRGILMGLPLTWPMLSLINEFCAYRACKAIRAEQQLAFATPPDRRTPRQMSLTKGSSKGRIRNDARGEAFGDFRVYAIGGDDFAAAWTSMHRDYYETNLRRLGMKVNDNKSYYSTSGLVFLEVLYTGRREMFTARGMHDHWATNSQKQEPLSKILAWQTERALAKAQSIRNNLPPREGGELYPALVVTRVSRVRLSALVSAKRQARQSEGAGEDQLPAWLTLSSAITSSYEEATTSWMRERVLDISRDMHPETYRQWNQSGLPLHWPQSLGGWGLPGPQQAPIEFRKAAAAILNGRQDLQQKLQSAFLTATAPKKLAKVLRLQLALVAELPERLPQTPLATGEGVWGARPGDNSKFSIQTLETREDADALGPLGSRHGIRTNWLVQCDPPPQRQVQLSDAERAVVRRTLALYSLDRVLSATEPVKASLGRLARQIRRTIQEARSTWKSAEPMNANKALRLDLAYIDRKVDVSQLDNMLHYTGTPDTLLKSSTRVTIQLRRPATANAGKPRTYGEWMGAVSIQYPKPKHDSRTTVSHPRPSVSAPGPGMWIPHVDTPTV